MEGVRGMALPCVLVAATILLAGLAWILVFWNAHRREPAPTHQRTSETTPPESLPVALAGAILSPSGGAGWTHALATLLDLAHRGVLRVEEVPRQRLVDAHKYVIRLVPGHADLRPHERGLLDLLFRRGAEPTTSVKLSAAGRAAQSHLKLFQRPLREELLAAGLVCPERSRTKGALVRGGLALVSVAALGLVVAGLSAEQLGPWPLLVPGAVLAVGLAVLIMAGAFGILTTSGRTRAARWASFLRFVGDTAGGRRPAVDPAWFEPYLAYAAARGRAAQWVRAFERSGRVSAAPAWFVPADSSGGSPLRRLADMLSRAKAAGEHQQGVGVVS